MSAPSSKSRSSNRSSARAGISSSSHASNSNPAAKSSSASSSGTTTLKIVPPPILPRKRAGDAFLVRGRACRQWLWGGSQVSACFVPVSFQNSLWVSFLFTCDSSWDEAMICAALARPLYFGRRFWGGTVLSGRRRRSRRLGLGGFISPSSVRSHSSRKRHILLVSQQGNLCSFILPFSFVARKRLIAFA
ncbi:hypothetical protein C8F04DRAFT_1103203 [Mycena alexandri]|uniref:Uncharacterized protein n=1 Tax=Mycena alexandri TaxID=1745969 RepID=A0AAD6SUY8_9AGAR|nr:hypothetical protein C8F04DRAFT_1103203 [Mycena alexandri]